MNTAPLSYWHRTASPFALFSRLPSSVETVVIGGGLLGTATCYWLAKAGVDVALLEREALAFGATGRNGGFVRIGPAGSYLEAKERLSAETARLFPSLRPQLHVAARWAGLMGCVSDSHPIVDVAPGLPGVFFVGGFSGHGMPFGLRLGQLLAESVTSGSLVADLWPFRLHRPSLLPWPHS